MAARYDLGLITRGLGFRVEDLGLSSKACSHPGTGSDGWGLQRSLPTKPTKRETLGLPHKAY